MYAAYSMTKRWKLGFFIALMTPVAFELFALLLSSALRPPGTRELLLWLPWLSLVVSLAIIHIIGQSSQMNFATAFIAAMVLLGFNMFLAHGLSHIG